MPARAAIALLLLVALSVAGCGASGGGAATETGATETGATGITVSDAWVRAREAGATTAAYMTVTNGGGADVQLVGVSAPAVTMDASLHETTDEGSGMTGMQHVDGIAVPAGGTVALEPGGYHVMLMDISEALEPGDTVTLTLTFDQAGEVEVTAEVRAG